jgi:hypothetical protein
MDRAFTLGEVVVNGDWSLPDRRLKEAKRAAGMLAWAIGEGKARCKRPVRRLVCKDMRYVMK